MVYVINKNNQPLMPTERYGKVRKMLRENKAIVIKREPFTIQLLYDTTDFTNILTLGVDSGSKMIGLSVTSLEKEYFSGEVIIRNDIVELLSERKQRREKRRYRLRYRQSRFLNRTKNKKKGWLAPSILNKINTHLKAVENLTKILPILNIIVETASFDIQKIKNPNIKGKEYQEGEQLEFWNIREYVLFRDGHKCHGKKDCKNKILNVHHIETRKTGGNSPSNLITLCEECHNDYHNGKLILNLKRGISFKDATFMGIMRWAFYNRLKEIYPNVKLTYGYITKNTRISNKIKKTHFSDAYCIAGNIMATQMIEFYKIKKVRCHNRKIHKANIAKGNLKKRNQSPYEVKGFRLFDKVLYRGIECFIFARRKNGFFNIQKIDRTIINSSANSKELTLIMKRRPYIIEKAKKEGDNSIVLDTRDILYNGL